ncbi:CHY zinc finger protein [Natrinema halophilum]|uniref:CHY-type domain-containing protein n=1 Tax=Natrinema halophilum TaxID=1699371 RepID=A0A7D5KBT6_9EURY|nr:CHY zinc finger protein [Natrinema halophilum]QLG48076.1 CHY zinc finger protein [Natrinema halophilum]
MTDHTVHGVEVDSETRCSHYRTDSDVVAFKFACCERYYPCFRCHEAVSGHEAVPWPRDRFDEPSVLCGVCDGELTVPEYLESDYRCPACGAAFNPGCSNHAELYFDIADRDP